MRPRLSQAPRRMVSISAADFSGKAAVRLRAPIVSSRSQRPGLAHGPAGEIGQRSGSSEPQQLDGADGERADAGVAGALGAPAQALLHSPRGRRHQKCTMTLPNTCRLSIRARPCSKSASAKFAVDDRRHAGGDLGQAVADIAHRAAERAENLVLLLEQLHQIDGHGRSRGRAAGDQASAALEAEQRAVEALAADMLEHHVDALLLGELAGDALEAVGLVVDDMVGAERLGLLGLGVVADGGDDGAAQAPSPS